MPKDLLNQIPIANSHCQQTTQVADSQNGINFPICDFASGCENSNFGVMVKVIGKLRQNLQRKIFK